MANERPSRSRGRPRLHLRLAHLLVISSLLYATVLLSHSTPPVGCTSSALSESVSAQTQNNDEESRSCQLPEGGEAKKLCADKLARREQNATHKKREQPLGTSPVYGRTPDELDDDNDSAHLAPAGDKSDPAQTWRFKYMEEQSNEFELKVLDSSFDERLANVIYTAASVRPTNTDFFTYNSGDPLEDAANMEAAAGPHVDADQCEHHLDKMLSLLDEMNEILAQKRANQSANRSFHFNENHLRLARMLESYGRYESGLLVGKQFVPGQPDQCTAIDLLLGGGGGGESKQRVPTRFCWARMDLSKHLNRGLAHRVKGPFEAAEHPLLLGICLPRTCHSKTFEANRERIQRLVDTQFQLPESLYIERTLPVGSVYCLPDRESAYTRLTLAGKFLLTFMLGWLALTLYATLYARDDNKSQSKRTGMSEQARAFWDCLDLRKSWREFIGEHEDSAAAARHESQARQRKVELNTLNPIKVGGCAFVVLGHTLLMKVVTAHNLLEGMHLVETDPIILAMIVGTVVVDTFFVISGILMGYVVMRHANRGEKVSAGRVSGTEKTQEASNGQVIATTTTTTTTTKKPPAAGMTRPRQSTSVARMFFTEWAKFAMARHLRLVPLFFLVFAFKKSILINYFSSWPLWDAGLNKDTNSGACRQESWTTPFSVAAAFIPLPKQCLPQAWSIATDLFFSLTIPPIALIMPRRPKLALVAGTITILISNFWSLFAYHNIDPIMAHEINDIRAHGLSYMFGDVHHLYTYPHYRYCSILIGMLAGYHLYLFGEQPDNLKHWPRWFSGTATKTAILTMVAIVLGFSQTAAMKYYIAPYHQYIFTNLFTSGRIVWALCNIVLFMRMASDWRRSFFMQNAAARFWQSCVRLNLAILLVHMDVLVFILGSNTQTGAEFGRRSILIKFASAYFFCIPVALVLHLIYENPIDKLTKRFVMARLFAR